VQKYIKIPNIRRNKMFSLFKKEPIKSNCDECETNKQFNNLKNEVKQLKNELNKTYIKDTLSNTYYNYTYNLLEYIEKNNETIVKVYKPKIDINTNTFYSIYEIEHVCTMEKDLCIEVRDFLLKHFPIEKE
jgi:hypothetical protein